MSGTSARAVVYCFGHAGGAAGSYLNWARRTTGQDVEICPVELPGHGTRMGEAQLTDVDVAPQTIRPRGICSVR